MKSIFGLLFLSVISTVHSQFSLGVADETMPSISESSDSSQCVSGRCANVSYKEIQRMFRGIFFTKRELKRKMMNLKVTMNSRPGQTSRPYKWWKENRKSYRKSRYLNHDADQCCPTTCNLIYPTELTNTRGVTRYIVHFTDMQPEPMYQFMPMGTCLYPGNCKNCQQEYALHSVLVIDTTFKIYPYFEFDDFYIKSYCSCKN
ncbi:uncharacterized protein LOC125666029 [Ostrea edulis]|uniref:uncharacterized protein LOC125666029 n=1 Tax=Ostrea edulis TaxID=37623 RepID=UPI0020949F64|nr:uncharacterized protein LOC125666029 [Ostrea edulis]